MGMAMPMVGLKYMSVLRIERSVAVSAALGSGGARYMRGRGYKKNELPTGVKQRRYVRGVVHRRLDVETLAPNASRQRQLILYIGRENRAAPETRRDPPSLAPKSSAANAPPPSRYRSSTAHSIALIRSSVSRAR